MARERGHKSPIIRLAPTGIAAFNIHGATLHRSLSLPLAGALSELIPAQFLRLQGRFDGIRFIIIDEKSMIGKKMLSRLDSKLQ
jgi:ATP-dependent DNA helicase PIF1